MPIVIPMIPGFKPVPQWYYDSGNIKGTIPWGHQFQPWWISLPCNSSFHSFLNFEILIAKNPDLSIFDSLLFSDCGDNWCPGINYFRLDGSTPAMERERLINAFNRDFSVKLFLVSTRAGVSFFTMERFKENFRRQRACFSRAGCSHNYISNFWDDF